MEEENRIPCCECQHDVRQAPYHAVALHQGRRVKGVGNYKFVSWVEGDREGEASLGGVVGTTTGDEPGDGPELYLAASEIMFT